MKAGRRTKLLVLTADPAGARQRRREQAETEHGVWLTTDETGTVIDIGRAHYAPTGLQQRLVRLRDGVCRFPGCSQDVVARDDIRVTRAEHTDESQDGALARHPSHAQPWNDGGQTTSTTSAPSVDTITQLKTHGG